MSTDSKQKVCVVVGASHAGVNFAFELRRAAWEGQIILFDTDPNLPYHRPPLSKEYLASKEGLDNPILKAVESYKKEQIELRLGIGVTNINRKEKSVQLTDGTQQGYDKLVLATGAQPLIPNIAGIENVPNIFPMRNAQDAINIRKTFERLKDKKVIVIGGGYIGLETAASLKKIGADVSVLERDASVLARVTAPVLSDFFQQLHQDHGVNIQTNKDVVQIKSSNQQLTMLCKDGSEFIGEMIILGVGIQVNTTLAEKAGLAIEGGGIKVNASACTNDPDIYAIGDCTFHHNPHYDRFIRLESVQNAVAQAKVAAAAISGQPNVSYDTIPWFWSDQYDVKLQMVGLSQGYDNMVVRKESKHHSFSIWYFKKDTLLAVDAINNGKAYVLGMKFIKTQQQVNKLVLGNTEIALHPKQLLSK